MEAGVYVVWYHLLTLDTKKPGRKHNPLPLAQIIYRAERWRTGREISRCPRRLATRADAHNTFDGQRLWGQRLGVAGARKGRGAEG